MSHFDAEDFSRFDNFQVIHTTYKTVSDHGIPAHVLIPKHIIAEPEATKPRPVLIRIHGGGFVAASSLFPPWFAPWTLELASRHSAVIVSPDYRLLPEATLDELLEDIEDFFAWVLKQLPGFVLEKTNGAVRVDPSRILTAGDSAGGYLSLQLGLDHPDEIKAVTASYPMVDSKGPDLTEPRQGPVLGLTSVPASVIDDHCDKVKQGLVPGVYSADEKLERIQMMFSLLLNGKYPEYVPAEKRNLHILDKLDDGARFPRGGVLVLHGKDDSAVPVSGSFVLAEKLKEVDPELKFHLEVQPGEHGFDGQASLDDEWLSKALEGPVASWLG